MVYGRNKVSPFCFLWVPVSEQDEFPQSRLTNNNNKTSSAVLRVRKGEVSDHHKLVILKKITHICAAFPSIVASLCTQWHCLIGALCFWISQRSERMLASEWWFPKDFVVWRVVRIRIKLTPCFRFPSWRRHPIPLGTGSFQRSSEGRLSCHLNLNFHYHCSIVMSLSVVPCLLLGVFIGFKRLGTHLCCCKIQENYASVCSCALSTSQRTS